MIENLVKIDNLSKVKGSSPICRQEPTETRFLKTIHLFTEITKWSAPSKHLKSNENSKRIKIKSIPFCQGTRIQSTGSRTGLTVGSLDHQSGKNCPCYLARVSRDLKMRSNLIQAMVPNCIHRTNRVDSV